MSQGGAAVTLTLAQFMFLGVIAAVFFIFLVAVVSRAKDYIFGGGQPKLSDARRTEAS